MKLIAVAAGLIASSYAYPQYDFVRRQAPSTNTSSSQVLPPSEDPWYTAPPNFEAAAPGAILRVRAAPGNLLGVAANSSAAYNILYRTTDSQYNPTWAVTTLLIPAANITTNNSELLSYQIPYDSASVNASPSYALSSGVPTDITRALGRGWYVNVPDYEGPLASFTAGVISGHATIDSIRAVLNSGFGLVNGTRYAMWGFSGGALASEWAAELQNQYAPEMEFAGAALGALTPNVTSVLESVSGSVTAGLIPSGILGLASQYPELEQFLIDNLKTEGQYNATTFFNARNQTLVQSIGTFINQDIAEYFVNGNDSLTSPLARRVTNRDGIMGYHGVPQFPLFAYKAIQDELSPVADTDKLIQRYCEVSATIRYERNTVGTHGTAIPEVNQRAVDFLAAVLSGSYNATIGECQISNVTLGSTS